MEEKEFLQKIEEIRKHLQEHLKKERYEHSLSVAFTSICLAMAHGVKDLDLAVKLCLEASIAYVKEKGQHCCSLSLDALAYYQEKKEV